MTKRCFDYHQVKDLPMLAWGMRMSINSEKIVVHHGCGIETLDSFFVEGAWDGRFEDGDFNRAITFTGSGVKLENSQVIVSSSSHNLERFFSLRKNDQLYFSNSLVLLLVISNEQLNLSHTDYFLDYLTHYRRGLRTLRKTIKSSSGVIELHDCQNTTISKDLVVTSSRRNFGHPHQQFTPYENMLLETTDNLFKNANDSARRIRYSPLSAISRGYDSTAVSAIAAECGCDSAYTFSSSNSNGALNNDSGAEIAGKLGMRCEIINRTHNCDANLEVIALHFPNVYAMLGGCLDQISGSLKGTILLSGRHGEHFWNLDRFRSLPWYQEITARGMPGQSMHEFRLKRGFIHFPLPYTGGVFAPHLFKIGHSDDMRKWRIGGSYDRPIARRIVESRGVPRRSFGMIKMGGGKRDDHSHTLSRSAMDSFSTYLKTEVPDEIRNRLREKSNSEIPFHETTRMKGFEKYCRYPLGLREVAERILANRSHPRRNTIYLYTFHWGLSLLTKEYKQAYINYEKSN